MNETLFGMTRCLLLESNLSNMFWADAVTTACYLCNKCPTSALDGGTPEEWTGNPIELDHLKVFGSRAWSIVDPPKTKLDPRAIECVFIGYPEGVKGYRLWDFANGKSVHQQKCGV